MVMIICTYFINPTTMTLMMMVMTTMAMTATDNNHENNNNKKHPDVYISILRRTRNAVLDQNKSQPHLVTTHTKQMNSIHQKKPQCCIIHRKHW
jgi:hypothetical protein